MGVQCKRNRDAITVIGIELRAVDAVHGTTRGWTPRGSRITRTGACAQGCDSVTLFGTTGEGAALGLPARTRPMLGALVGAGIDPSRKIYAGIAAASLP